MKAGRLCRTVIDILQDSSNDGDETPVFTGTAFASGLRVQIESVSGNESFRGRQLEAGINYVVMLRYLAAITPTMRVSVTQGVFTGLVMDIRYVQHLPYKQGKLPETWLFCGDVPA